MPNLNYPDYNKGFGAYGSAPSAPSSVLSSAPNKFLQYAAPVSAIAGIGLESYGTYQQNKALQDQYELQKEAFATKEERALRKEEEDRRQRQLQNALTYGGYAQGAEDQALDTYGSYASRVGL